MYYLVAIGNKGMRSSGQFTKDISKWMTFSEADKQYFEGNNIRPYGASPRYWNKATFVETSKFH